MTRQSVAIIGAGMAGLCMAIRLREAGYQEIAIYEKADSAGGTWRENTYPGVSCDVPSHLYSYSFALNADWSRAFSSGAEIRAYIERCIERYRIRQYIHYGTEIDRCAYTDNGWQLNDTNGKRYTADALVSAMGGLHIPNIPDIPGSDQFAGAVFHSARWDHDFDPAGKRVAVIGSAASAVQIVPQLARQTRHLYVFQRTANWIIPRGDGDVAGWKKWILRRVPGALRAYRWLLYWMAESRFPAFRSGSLANRLGRLWPLWYLRREVPDRKLRRQLTPDYPLGCKRILRSDDYYRALVRDDVELVTAPVRQFDNSGIEAGNDHYAVDAIVFATGFRVFDVTSNVRIEGQSGQLLSERWAEGIGAHRTVMVPGFPNFFMLLGPNSALGHNSVIVMIEAQTRYVVGCLEALQAHRWQSLQPSTSAYKRDQEKIHKALDKTVWRAGCSSWYQDEHGKIFTLWPHTATRYRLSLRRPRLDEFDVD